MKICKVETKKEIVDVDYEVCGSGYCCDKLKEHLNIGNGYGRKNLAYNTGTERFGICVREAEDHYGSYGNDSASKYDDLDFCPFCGERLQRTIIKETSKEKEMG